MLRRIMPVSWEFTGNTKFPYSAKVMGKEWTIRINDFPEQQIYTLLVDGEEDASFDSWPELWNKPPVEGWK